MKYKEKQTILNRLSEVLTLIRIKEGEVQTALAYNKKFDMLESIDIQEIQAERETFISEFNLLKRGL